MNARRASVSTPAKRFKASPLAKRKKRVPLRPTKVFIGRQPFPKQLFNTLTYTEVYSLNVVTGNGRFLYRANGMYDPNALGTGHQPMYFDQLTAIYDHWTVLRSRITASFSCNSTPSHGCVAAIYLEDDGASYAPNALDAAERPGAVTKTWAPLAEGACTLYHSYDASKTFGANPQAQDDLNGTALADPTEQALWALYIHDPALGSFTGYITIKIDYDVVWEEFKTITGS